MGRYKPCAIGEEAYPGLISNGVSNALIFLHTLNMDFGSDICFKEKAVN